MRVFLKSDISKSQTVVVIPVCARRSRRDGFRRRCFFASSSFLLPLARHPAAGAAAVGLTEWLRNESEMDHDESRGKRSRGGGGAGDPPSALPEWGSEASEALKESVSLLRAAARPHSMRARRCKEGHARPREGMRREGGLRSARTFFTQLNEEDFSTTPRGIFDIEEIHKML